VLHLGKILPHSKTDEHASLFVQSDVDLGKKSFITSASDFQPHLHHQQQPPLETGGPDYDPYARQVELGARPGFSRIRPYGVSSSDDEIRFQYFIKISLCSSSLTLRAGNTKGGSITVPLTSCLTGLELAV